MDCSDRGRLFSTFPLRGNLTRKGPEPNVSIRARHEDDGCDPPPPTSSFGRAIVDDKILHRLPPLRKRQLEHRSSSYDRVMVKKVESPWQYGLEPSEQRLIAVPDEFLCRVLLKLLRPCLAENVFEARVPEPVDLNQLRGIHQTSCHC